MNRETFYCDTLSGTEPSNWSKSAAVRGNQSGFEV